MMTQRKAITIAMVVGIVAGAIGVVAWVYDNWLALGGAATAAIITVVLAGRVRA